MTAPFQVGDRVRLSAKGAAYFLKRPDRIGTVATMGKKFGHPIIHWDGNAGRDRYPTRPCFLVAALGRGPLV